MSRCDCEGVFYRVFCVSLLIIAFTFTVILTNVFVDIDNLLSRKEGDSTDNLEAIDRVTEDVGTTTEVQDYYIVDERTKDEDNYRTKRSLDSEKVFLHINNPKAKSYLTNRLAALLEALDEEEPEITTPKHDNGNIYIKTVKQKNNIEINEVQSESIEKREQKKKDEDILHLTMHNILLQGILGRMGMNEMYNTLQKLVSSFKYGESEKDVKNANRFEEYFTETTTQGKINLNEEQNLIEELLKYKKNKPRDHIFEFNDADTNDEDEIRNDKKRSRGKKKSPKYLIKTLIDIKKDENANSKENFQGIIKLIYNGKPIKIRGEDHDETTTVKTTTTTEKQKIETTERSPRTETTTNIINKDVEDFADVLKDNYKNKHVPDSYLKTILLEYLKKFGKANDSSATLLEKKKIRIKRNLEWSNEKQTEIPQTKEDEELFVEIETHFDKKGLRGEKKRKLVSSLIKKIQNAIGSNSENKQIDIESRESRIMKRVQNPLDHRTVSATPTSNLYRAQDPISKTHPLTETLPNIAIEVDSQKKERYGPKFLSPSKSINSAEMSQIDIDYSKNVPEPVVPKRVQVPLTTDASDENINTIDVGKLQLLIKDIEGTGFSIGYNQYVDQAPDPESIKLFHGIEHIVNEYHQKNDKSDQTADHEVDYEIYGQELKKREVEKNDSPARTKRFVLNKHNVRRSVDQFDGYHANGYKYIYNDNYRSYNAYKEIYNKRESNTKNETNNLRQLVFKRTGKPLEINGYRKKRSLNVKRIVNLNKKIRVSKYLNTNTVPRQRRDFKINKRNKRQTNNMQFIATTGQASESNDMFIVSDGAMYNDNLIVRHRNLPKFFFGVVEEVKSGKENPFLKNKPFFQLHQQLSPQTIKRVYEKKTLFTENKSNLFKRPGEEREKRQVQKIRIIARGMTHKDSNDKSFSEYDENPFSGRTVRTQLDEPQVITVDDKESQIELETDHEESIFRNPYTLDKTEHETFENNNPIGFGHDKHPFSLDPVVNQMKDNPLMLKYPHIFVEDRTSGEHPELKLFHRTFYSRPEGKESDASSDNEALYQTPNLQDLVNAMAPNHRKKYKVSVKLLPHDNDNDTKAGFKEVHTTINKTFNKNGVIYSSLVNVSKISKVELSNKTNVNTTHLCSHQFQSTTRASIGQTMKPKQTLRGPETILVNEKLLAEYNKERNKILKLMKNKSREGIAENQEQRSLMDIILPSSPPKVLHLTIADVGKLICDAIKSQNTDKSTTSIMTTTSEKVTPKTTITTTLPSTEPVLATTKPVRKPYVNPQTVDPLKMKLLKAISLNEQLTSQILDRVNQNTDILQTFLTKISGEIAKLPNITKQAIMEKNNKLNPHEISKDFSTNNTKVVPFAYAVAQVTPPPPLPENPAKELHNTHMQPSSMVKMLRMNDRMTELQRNVKTNNSEEKQRERTKYFLDDDLNKTVSHTLVESNDSNKLALSDAIENDTTGKHIDYVSNNNFDPTHTINNIRRIGSVNGNAILQNNTVHYLT